MPGPTPALCTFPEAFVQEALATVRRRTVAVQAVHAFDSSCCFMSLCYGVLVLLPRVILVNTTITAEDLLPYQQFMYCPCTSSRVGLSSIAAIFSRNHSGRQALLREGGGPPGCDRRSGL